MHKRPEFTDDQQACFRAWLTDEYTRMGKEGVFSGMSILQHAPKIADLFKAHSVTNYIDYGCGQARAYTANPRFLDPFRLARLYDCYVERFSVFPGAKADAVVCIDVLEHLPRFMIAEVLGKIFSLAKKLVFLTYCPRAARKSFSDGTNVHLTIENENFWQAQVDAANIQKLPFYLKESK